MNDRTLEKFARGESVGEYSTQDQGQAWDTVSYSERQHFDSKNGVDVLGDVSERHMVEVEAENYREIDADIPELQHLEDVIEYDVDVTVISEDLEEKESRNATVLSGRPEQVTPAVWAAKAVEAAYEDTTVGRLETSRDFNGESNPNSGELNFLLDEDENEEGIDVIR